MSAKAKSKLTPEQQKATMTRVLQKIKPYGFFVVCSLIVAAVSVAAQLYIPILCGSAIDMMLGKGAVDHAGVLRIIYEIIVVAVVAAFAQWLLSVCNTASPSQSAVTCATPPCGRSRPFPLLPRQPYLPATS